MLCFRMAKIRIIMEKCVQSTSVFCFFSKQTTIGIVRRLTAATVTCEVSAVGRRVVVWAPVMAFQKTKVKTKNYSLFFCLIAGKCLTLQPTTIVMATIIYIFINN